MSDIEHRTPHQDTISPALAKDFFNFVKDLITPEQRVLLQHYDVVTALEPEVKEMLKGTEYLLPVKVPDSADPREKRKEKWQPSDFLPNSEAGDDEYFEQLRILRSNAREASDGLLVSVTGNMITEDAVPTYTSALNRLAGIADETGVDDTGWARWIRGWTAEESTHEAWLDAYLRYTGRVSMGEAERTKQSLIVEGMDPRSMNDPYHGIFYTSPQEALTKDSHNGVARFANQEGVDELARGAGKLAGDELRHEKFYTWAAGRIFDLDPNGAMIALAQIMKNQIIMPAARMTDGTPFDRQTRQSQLFSDFADVQQALGILTAEDYFRNIVRLKKAWDVDHRSVTGEAARAQDQLGRYTLEHGQKVDRLMTRRIEAEDKPAPKFPWIYGREVPLAPLTTVFKRRR